MEKNLPENRKYAIKHCPLGGRFSRSSRNHVFVCLFYLDSEFRLTLQSGGKIEPRYLAKLIYFESTQRKCRTCLNRAGFTATPCKLPTTWQRSSRRRLASRELSVQWARESHSVWREAEESRSNSPRARFPSLPVRCTRGRRWAYFGLCEKQQRVEPSWM